jgi:DNA modification methylase
VTADVLVGDCLEVLPTLPAASAHCVVTSPPYWGLRDYGHDGQLGLERTPDEYVERLVSVFRLVRRVLRDDGTVWLNLGDSYANTGGVSQPHRNVGTGGFAGSDGRRTQPYALAGGGFSRPVALGNGLKPKDLVGIPWRVAFALQADGWYLRSDIIWHKPNPMPESVTDRPTKSHEYIFLLTKSERYHYDHEAIKEPSVDPESHEGYRPRNPNGHGAVGGKLAATRQGFFSKARAGVTYEVRNKRSVWTIATAPYPEAHFATYPPELIRPCILAGSPQGGTVLDPFNGSGTTGLVALQHHRRYIGIELNPEYARLTRTRLAPILAQPHLFTPREAVA